MKDITNSFGTYFHPVSALVFYQSENYTRESYVEHYDIDKSGNPINAHPLTVREAKKLAESLHIDQKKNNLLHSDGLLDSNILSFDAKIGKIIWFTKAQFRQLHFGQGLGIASGMAHTPALLWIAHKESLNIHALSGNRRPTPNTQLYYAPFFNVYQNGNVCMGTVDIEVNETGSIKQLTTLWESYFFNSYFTHLMSEHNPVNGNCVLLWESLINSEKPFPNEALIKNNRKLKDILL
ncbi:prokaryotic E2 ligase family D protein [Sphingobacterium sp. SRCM116780]|uniref:prokaryotic E2 ligase family D protein n=1 Tax=Sphingobacterium sp. SRCM116780 TaxID=2907623 RepID=UPI001F1ED0C9|nr:prokaryotic E2 ligase family D protein [Sphingobacterium sp. SRCM116780]UIR57807.1 prokaryotic E2 ligase family D protein [Sphingobacterium sp. SRCM116780]